jgi:uncharacterized protein (DUF1919 family)
MQGLLRSRTSVSIARLGCAAARRFISAYRRSGLALAKALLSGHQFTVISNNCWGAHIYRALGMPYLTPFVGLFVPPPFYLELLRDFERLIAGDLSFTRGSALDSVNEFRTKRGLDYPIGVLSGKVEIHFMHYSTREECSSKWQRRVGRMVRPPEDCLFKFCDHDGASLDELQAFDRLAYPQKVCFTGRAAPCLSNAVCIPSTGIDHVPDGGELAAVSPRYFNALRWIAADGVRSLAMPPGIL